MWSGHKSSMTKHHGNPQINTISVHVNGTIWSLNLTRLPSKGFPLKGGLTCKRLQTGPARREQELCLPSARLPTFNDILQKQAHVPAFSFRCNSSSSLRSFLEVARSGQCFQHLQKFSLSRHSPGLCLILSLPSLWSVFLAILQAYPACPSALYYSYMTYVGAMGIVRAEWHDFECCFFCYALVKKSTNTEKTSSFRAAWSKMSFFPSIVPLSLPVGISQSTCVYLY